MVQAQLGDGVSAQASPPLLLSGTGQLRTPATIPQTMVDCVLDGLNGGLEPGPMGFGAQAVHSLAVRTVQAAEYDHLRHPVKPGGDEPMPPEVTVTDGTGRGSLPVKFPAVGN
jgi:hypothetical protein